MAMKKGKVIIDLVGNEAVDDWIRLGQLISSEDPDDQAEAERMERTKLKRIVDN